MECWALSQLFHSPLSLSSRGLSVFITIPKKGNAKECSNYRTIALISHASKVMLKILKPGFSNTWTMNFLMFKLVLEKAEEPEIKLATSAGSWRKQKSSRKTSISALLTMPQPYPFLPHNIFTVVGFLCCLLCIFLKTCNYRGNSRVQSHSQNYWPLFLLYWLCQSLWLCGSQ